MHVNELIEKKNLVLHERHKRGLEREAFILKVSSISFDSITHFTNSTNLTLLKVV